MARMIWPVAGLSQMSQIVITCRNGQAGFKVTICDLEPVHQPADNLKLKKPIESLILEIRRQRVLIDADLAAIYGVETRALNQAVKRNAGRFPEDFIFQLNADEKLEVITNCDHLAGLKFAKSLPFAFTEHGAIMAAMVLNSPEAVKLSVFVVRAFMQMREQLVANATILKRLAAIDKTLLQHDSALRMTWAKLQPLLAPPPEPPKRRIGFDRENET